MTPLKSNYKVDSLSTVQEQDGLYGVMLAAMRNAEEVCLSQGRGRDRETISLLTHKVLLSAMREYVKLG